MRKTGGTISSPLLTFAEGVSKLSNAGDRLFLRAGIYRGTATIAKNGADANPILISAYNGEDVTIKGSQVITGLVRYTAAENGAVIYKVDWSYESQQVFVDGVLLQQTGSVADPIAGVASDGSWKIEDPNDPNSPYILTLSDLDDDGHDGMFFYDKDAEVLYIRLVGDASLTDKIIEVSKDEQILNAYKSSYILIKGLKFRHNNGSTFKAGAGMIELGNNCIIEDCDIQWGDQAGIAAGYRKTGSKIINCILNNNGNTGITASATYNFLVKGCELNNNNNRKFNYLWHAGGIKVVSYSYGDIVDCEVANNYGSGIWYDYCNTSNDMIVSGNYIHDNGPKHAGIFLEVSNNIKVYNNIVDNNTRIGIAIEGSEYIDVYNNDIMNTHGVAGVRIQRDPIEGMTLSNNYIYNNVFYNNGLNSSADIDIQKDNPDSRVEKNYADYNIYYNTNGVYKLKYGLVTSSIEIWRSWRFDINGLIGNPGYVTVLDGDVRKSNISQTIDVGIDVDFIAKDYYGTSRPQNNNFDIGAFEFDGTVIINEAPVASAGNDTTIYDIDKNGIERVMLDASASYDSDGIIESYTWFLNGVIKSEGENTEVLLMVGENILTLTVIDNKGAVGTDDIIITIAPTTEISNPKSINFNMYPNPATVGVHVVTSKHSKNIRVIITNTLGQIVVSANTTIIDDNYISLSNLKNGNYVVNIIENSKIIGSKILIIE